MDRIAARREAARKRAGQLTVTDPRFNLREVLKQMVLLEDHLFQPHKFCLDCVRKHLLTIEAFCEEGVTLAGANSFYAEIKDTFVELSAKARGWLVSIHDGVPPIEVGDGIRVVRKELMPKGSDPRDDVIHRIAHLHLLRKIRHRS